MKNAAEILSRMPTKGQLPASENEAVGGDHAQAVARVFTAFFGAWGKAFSGAYESGVRDEKGRDQGVRAAMATWAGMLKDFDADTLARATKRVIDEGGDFAPKLPKFRAVCAALTPPISYAQIQGWQPPKALPAPAIDVVYPKLVGDKRDWARRIIAEVEQGVRRSHASVRLAREALGLCLE